MESLSIAFLIFLRNKQSWDDILFQLAAPLTPEKQEDSQFFIMVPFDMYWLLRAPVQLALV